MLHGSRGDDGEKLVGIEWSSERMSPYTVSALTSYVANFCARSDLENTESSSRVGSTSAQPETKQWCQERSPRPGP